jgi:hypothetical protein
MFPQVACPKCGRQLDASGVVSIDGGPERPVYLCEDCLVPTQVFGETMQMPLTFYIDRHGRAVNPAAPDQPLFPGPSDN